MENKNDNSLDEVYEDVDFDDIFGEGNEEAQKPQTKRVKKSTTRKKSNTKSDNSTPPVSQSKPAKKTDRQSGPYKQENDLSKEDVDRIDNSDLVREDGELLVNGEGSDLSSKYYDGTAKVHKDLIMEMQRREEIEAEIIRKNKGRYIEAVDDVKPSKTLDGEEFIKSANPQGYSLGMFVNQQYDNSDSNNENYSDIEPTTLQAPQIVNGKIRADGVTLSATGVLDPGAGSQKARVAPQDEATELSNGSDGEYIVKRVDDPESEEYRVCMNSSCAYREGCLRYRLNPNKVSRNLFYPESCRIDGVYQPVEGSGITGLVPFDVLESKSTPSL